MEQKLFAVRDSKGEFYTSPFTKATVAEATRDFHIARKNNDTMISKYPEDFDLYEIGTYNSITGKVSALDTPSHIVKAVNLPTA